MTPNTREDEDYTSDQNNPNKQLPIEHNSGNIVGLLYASFYHFI